MFYNPIYSRIYQSVMNRKITWDALSLVPKDQIEVLFEITGPQMPHKIFKWLPYNFDNRQRMEVWCDYFLDKTGNGSVGPRIYNDHPHFVGYSQLNKEKGWFIKVGHEINSYYPNRDGTFPEYDVYIKARRRITKKNIDGEWVNITDIHDRITFTFDKAKDRNDTIKELKKAGLKTFRHPIVNNLQWREHHLVRIKEYKISCWKE